MGAVSTAFITQFGAEVKHAYQQVKPKIVSATRVHRNVVGSTYTFQKLGALTANTRSARNADITALSPDHTSVNATLADYFAGVYLDDLDRMKTNVDVRREYVMGTTAAIARKQDGVVVAALDAATMATGHTIAHGSAGLTQAKILEASKLLNLQDVPVEDRFLVVSPAQLEDAMGVSTITSADYQIANVAQGLLTGQINKAFGFTWIISNELSVATGVRSCWAFDRNAVGTAIGHDMSVKINYSPDKDSHLVLAKTAIGAAVIDTNGVVEVQCSE